MIRKFRRKSILRLAEGMRQEPRSATLGPKEEISELQINGQQGGANKRETDEKRFKEVGDDENESEAEEHLRIGA